MASTIADARGLNLSVAFARQFDELKAAIGAVEDAIARFQTAERSLAASYRDEEVRRLPVQELQRDWREANAAIWPKSWFGKRRVRKLLQSYAQAGNADAERDLMALQAMQHALSAVEASGPATTRRSGRVRVLISVVCGAISIEPLVCARRYRG